MNNTGPHPIDLIIRDARRTIRMENRHIADLLAGAPIGTYWGLQQARTAIQRAEMTLLQNGAL